MDLEYGGGGDSRLAAKYYLAVKKEGHAAVCVSVDEPGRYYAKGHYPDTEDKYYVISHVESKNVKLTEAEEADGRMVATGAGGRPRRYQTKGSNFLL